MTTTSAKPPAPAVAPAKAPRGPLLTLVRGTPRHRAAVAAGPVLALAALYLGSGLEPFRVGQLTSVLIFAIAISGLNLVTGYTGLLSIGHSAFFGLGAYTTGVMIVSYQVEPLLTLPVAAVLCFVLGFIVGLPALRIRGLYLALVTLAVGVAFPELVKRFTDLTGGAAGLVIRSRQLAPPQWTGLGAGQRYLWLYWVSAVVLILVIVLLRNLTRSRLGMAMLAVRDNELSAASSGVHIASVKTLAFGLSGAVTGLAGGLFAMYVGALSPDGSFTLLKSIELITGLFLGGAATLYGPVAGALAVVFLPYFTADLVSGHVSGILFGAVLIAIVFLMPEGIVGRLGATARRLVRVESRPGTPDLPSDPTPRAPQGDARKK
ncbi:branched-chain amino acid transport system permease protein [Actinocorallia herbida]|uniref:Branched-chain amino acid transport system permease protein n=1 Tax=Actinocorallia herbida TaxID=58109 RepID=A0A3N1CYV4_9ACTN|nr:branched-chain amino acid ABC transporter permease [Actinocorallia herbida]ROO86464.1 branched-chain amino acid transport system permease protein [Actinocorallia herbida]